MSEREDVEAGAMGFIKRLVGAWDCCGTCAGGVLATHDEQVRTEALAPVRASVKALLWELPSEFGEDPATTGTRSQFSVIKKTNVRAVHRALWDLQVLAALPPERLAGEVGAE